MDNGDNGTYVIDKQFNIVDRLFYNGPEQNNHPFEEMTFAFREANDRFFISQNGKVRTY